MKHLLLTLLVVTLLCPAVARAKEFRVETVVEGLDNPWAIVPTEDGKFFITEGKGQIRILDGNKLSKPLNGMPKIVKAGQGGLLDLALHPEFSSNKWLYIAYTVSSFGGYNLEVSRYTLSSNNLTNRKKIFRTVMDNDDPSHFGSRLLFARDNKLYITLGERHERELAQSLKHLNGKILRLNDNGTIPKDNPFVGSSNRQEIFSYGHRNPQGLDMHPETGMLVSTEHGPSGYDAKGGGDEVNIIKKGKNYGWPVIHHNEKKEGMLSPLVEFTPAIAPSGAAFYKGDKFPQWKNDFFFVGLRGKSLHRVKFDKEKVVETESLIKGQYGRLRDVASGADGFIYIITSDTDQYGPGRKNGDRVLRLIP